MDDYVEILYCETIAIKCDAKAANFKVIYRYVPSSQLLHAWHTV
jgi:hypothetical protein